MYSNRFRFARQTHGVGSTRIASALSHRMSRFDRIRQRGISMLSTETSHACISPARLQQTDAPNQGPNRPSFRAMLPYSTRERHRYGAMTATTRDNVARPYQTALSRSFGGLKSRPSNNHAAIVYGRVAGNKENPRGAQQRGNHTTNSASLPACSSGSCDA